jgi:hypothetical protein
VIASANSFEGGSETKLGVIKQPALTRTPEKQNLAELLKILWYKVLGDFDRQTNIGD